MDDDLNPEALERMVPLEAAGAQRARERRGDTRLDVVPEPIRPWTAGEILDVSLDVFRERFLLLAGTCVLIFFPLRALSPFVAPHAWMDMETAELDLVGGALFLVWALAGGVIAALAQAVVMQHALATLEGRTLGLGASFALALRRLLALVVLSILYSVVVSVGLMCVAVPGIFLAWKFWASKPALILEDASIGTAIQRSFDLTKESFGRWFAVALARWVFVGGLAYTVALPDDPTFRTVLLDSLPVSEVTFDIVTVFVSAIMMGTLTALSAIVETIYYVDCRVRRDGYDLDLALERMAESSPRTELAGGPVS